MFLNISKKDVRIRFIPMRNKLWVETSSPYLLFHPMYEKPIRRSRYLYPCIVRGEEDQGIKWLNASKYLHRTIVDGVVKSAEIPNLNLFHKFIKWLSKYFNFFKRFVPLPKSAIDLVEGYDFLIVKQMKGKTKEHEGFPCYDNSSFIEIPCRAGSDEQIYKWINETEKVPTIVEEN